ncbi:MAG: SLC45 family MFS transporter [Chloroflexi bacterium]|nr:SLC45 family MFS transporter [Chloroflexota bacterium]
MKQHLSVTKLISLNSYWFGLSFLWNSLHPIILPAILLSYVPAANKNTYLGLLSFLGLILAMVVQPLSGSISDRSTSRWGRRVPFIAIGTLSDMVIILFVTFTHTLLGIFMGYIALQISSNIAHGPMQAIIPDMVSEKQQGLASGIKNFMDVAGVIAASLLAGSLITPTGTGSDRIFVVIMVILGITALITILAAANRNDENKALKLPSNIKIKELFKIDKQAHPVFVNLIQTRFIFLLGVYGIQTFAQYYIGDVLQVENAVKTTGSVMAVIAGALVVSVLIAGWLIERTGPRKLMNTAMMLTALGSMVLFFIQEIGTFTIVAGFIGAGMGLYLTSNWTVAVKLAPTEQAGKFMGLTNLATAGASAVGKLEGPFIDLANRWEAGAFWGYRLMFLFSVLCSLVSFYLYNHSLKKHDHSSG